MRCPLCSHDGDGWESAGTWWRLIAPDGVETLGEDRTDVEGEPGLIDRPELWWCPVCEVIVEPLTTFVAAVGQRGLFEGKT